MKFARTLDHTNSTTGLNINDLKAKAIHGAKSAPYMTLRLSVIFIDEFHRKCGDVSNVMLPPPIREI
jgi:hypothetical protein